MNTTPKTDDDRPKPNKTPAEKNDAKEIEKQRAELARLIGELLAWYWLRQPRE